MLIDQVQVLRNSNVLYYADPNMGGEFLEEEALPVLNLSMVCTM
jgi:hypothetical protein